ncbi:hypothetical membrane protein [Pelotomaculum thermopropionicum SI]|uniref:Hypothetical membrane protein n=1 Tax=Pelotomaculum thermopropionicum (strain DSM 13744 / JCM 10971 / SI) TaxID=370438 RepID=A5CZA1_PELTS|nr:hypothetical membrane protein [Pelotomaculum thermopropionicum SI]
MRIITFALLILAALALVAGPAVATIPAESQTAQAAVYAEAADTQAAQGTTLPESAPNVPEKVGGIGDKLTDLAAALVPVGLIVAAVALMFSAKTGQKLLIYVVAGAALALGGWKLIVDVIRYVFAGW